MKNLQKQFDKEKDIYSRCEMIEANPSLATQENFNNEKWHNVRCAMIKENENLLKSSDAEAREKVFNLFHKELFDNRDLTADENYQTWYMTDIIIKEVKNNVFGNHHFWEYPVYTNILKSEIQKIILSNEFIEMPNIVSKRVFLINEITEIAHNQYCK